MTLVKYFEQYPVIDHKLRFIGADDGLIHVTLTPDGFEEGSTPFVFPNVVEMECKLYSAGLCRGSKV